MLSVPGKSFVCFCSFKENIEEKASRSSIFPTVFHLEVARSARSKKKINQARESPTSLLYSKRVKVSEGEMVT